MERVHVVGEPGQEAWGTEVSQWGPGTKSPEAEAKCENLHTIFNVFLHKI